MLFNWHPVLMALAFSVFMAEALLAYEAPILPGCSRWVCRCQWILHSTSAKASNPELQGCKDRAWQAVFAAAQLTRVEFNLVRRETRKKIHYSLHMCAVVCAALGVRAAWASHSLKLPVPIPHLYSPHSFLGMATVVLLAIQVWDAYSHAHPGVILVLGRPAHCRNGFRMDVVLGKPAHPHAHICITPCMLAVGLTEWGASGS